MRYGSAFFFVHVTCPLFLVAVVLLVHVVDLILLIYSFAKFFDDLFYTHFHHHDVFMHFANAPHSVS